MDKTRAYFIGLVGSQTDKPMQIISPFLPPRIVQIKLTSLEDFLEYDLPC